MAEGRSRVAVVQACEALENPIQLIRGDPDALIRDAHDRLIVLDPDLDGHAPAEGRVVHGVAQEVSHHNFYLAGVCYNQRLSHAGLQGYDMPVRRGLHRGDRTFQKRQERHRLRVQLQDPSIQAGDL